MVSPADGPSMAVCVFLPRSCATPPAVGSMSGCVDLTVATLAGASACAEVPADGLAEDLCSLASPVLLLLAGMSPRFRVFCAPILGKFARDGEFVAVDAMSVAVAVDCVDVSPAVACAAVSWATVSLRTLAAVCSAAADEDARALDVVDVDEAGFEAALRRSSVRVGLPFSGAVCATTVAVGGSVTLASTVEGAGGVTGALSVGVDVGVVGCSGTPVGCADVAPCCVCAADACG